MIFPPRPGRSYRKSTQQQVKRSLGAKITPILFAIGITMTLMQAEKEQIPAVQQVETPPSAILHWNKRSHEAIEALQIDGPVSIELRNCSDITITACNLASIALFDCEHITIRNCWIHDSVRCGVNIYQSHHVLVEGCRIEQVATGVYADQSQQIQVRGNFVRNMIGPFPRGQLAQFNNVTGRENLISGNYAINEHRKSHHEDAINLYMSQGEADSPIVVEDNYLTGDPRLGSQDMSKTGSGIMLGDYGGAYIICRRNTIISAGQVGLGVAGGRFIWVEDNLIYGQNSNVSNVGLYIWNQSGQPSDHIVLARNRVSWLGQEGAHPWWNGGGIGDVELNGNQFSDKSLPQKLPKPPSAPPMPPHPWISRQVDGSRVLRLPWVQAP